MLMACPEGCSAEDIVRAIEITTVQCRENCKVLAKGDSERQSELTKKLAVTSRYKKIITMPIHYHNDRDEFYDQ